MASSQEPLGCPGPGHLGLENDRWSKHISPKITLNCDGESSGSLDCWVFRPGKGLLHECEENQLFPRKQWKTAGSQ